MLQTKRNVIVLALCCCLAMVWNGAALAASPYGQWLTEGGKSRVEIAECDNSLCGKIVWLAEPLDEAGQEKLDKNNPDAALQSRPILGLALLNGFVPGDEKTVWVDGEIYNPEDGETYSCTLTLQDDGTLKVRGYVGLPLFGKTQIWTRAPKTE